ncbi:MULTISPECIES: SDR family oxidoreductase [Legionella]|uniref:NAD-dependent epimerase/dehydratase n=1 Tax=Legionella steelei TaxID=947033 RepID=A0A0W0ZGU5_9GAMM|nr:MULTISPECIES: SDR family oxidoreductase [Legionella]KTD68373.1 NAD-dependent epimerase/dehydratase [Legionella steelei]MBN9226486.1 SDR family oxidoreductase [Legionella steelei]OJW12216.1 MAG: NAD(P)-dependent oxidoreductase [Legionella sp. 39-23]
MTTAFFIFGFGYTANRLAEKLIQLGFAVVGTTRQERKKTTNHSPVITLIDFEASDIKYYLSQSTHILISVPPIPGIGDLILSNYSDLIKQYAAHIEWIGYLSSTGVYGNYQGNWVDESSICRPQSSSGILRLEAENAWLSYARYNKLPLHIFRLAGIYGPERNPLERIQSGKKYSIYKEGQMFSRVHVDDIVSILLASIKKTNPLSIYNVADDEPAASHVVDAYAASLLKQVPLPLILFEEASLSPKEQEFYLSNRRVSNEKIKRELNIVFRYPSFREGLSKIWSDDFEQNERN